MKKILTLTIMTLAIFCSALYIKAPVVVIASAENQNVLTFELNEDGKTYCVTDCDESAKGEVVIPSTYNSLPVTEIGEGAFYWCTGVTSLYIPDTVLVIGNGAFCECMGMAEITIPDSVTIIGDEAFNGCTQLASVTIPDSVTRIGEHAFACCESLTSIIIPDSVVSIGEEAFYGCTSLTLIEIGNGLKNMSWGIFSNCESLESITIPENVTSIGINAFEYCKNLERIIIPHSVITIEENAFDHCSNLMYIFYTGTQEQWDSIGIEDGNARLKNAYVHYGCTDHVVSDVWLNDMDYNCLSGESGELYKHCKYCEYVFDIMTIPSGHVYENEICIICNYCDYDYEIINNEITITGYNGSDTEITIPAYIGGYPVTSIGDAAFFCSRVTSVVLLRGMQSIGNNSFKEAHNLLSITIPDGLKSIGDYAFEGCRKLELITIPSSVTNIGECAFILCDNLDKINVHNGNANYSSVNGVLFNKNKTQLIKVPCNTVGEYLIPESVTSIEKVAFLCCEKITSIDIPDTLTSIGEGAFSGCINLLSISLPDGITSIEESVFYWCVKLESIKLPSKLKSIGESAFESCVGIKSIEIPETVTIIDDGAFYSCMGLESVRIPERVTHVGNGAFMFCSALDEIIFSGDAPSFEERTFAFTVTNVYYPVNKSGWSSVVGNDYGGTLIWVSDSRLKITTQPTSVRASNGKLATVTVKATSDGLTYKWYYKNADSAEFVYTPTFKSNTYSVQMNSTRAGRRVFCIITDKYGNSIKSKTVTLYMGNCVNITVQPTSVRVANGKEATVKVKATGDGLTYKWYYANKGSNTFAYTSSFKGDSYSVNMNSTRAGRKVYCVVTDKYGNSVKTNTVTLNMGNCVNITVQPTSVRVANGKEATVKVKATGDGLTYKWYYANKGSSTFTYTSTFKNNTYSVSMNSTRAGRKVYCVVTDKYGNSVKTNTVTLNIAK